ncbi:MAG: diguanylate cyclase [Alteromonadaceae bacterium]|nr:diguanylate cyclase [Alteromonadaceae bacterium]
MLKELLVDKAKIIFAKSGQQALELAARHRPDLILLDVVMPDLSGFEVIERLKNDQQTMNISVIFITGLANSDDEERGFSLGGCDYIYKPFKSKLVLARVMMHLELIRQRKLLTEIVHVDALTGIANRRRMDLVLKNEISASERDRTSLLIALLDVDFFKQYNDHYGHGAGDIALKKVSAVLQQILQRPRDFVARYGGEEFMLIIPDCDESGANQIFNNLFALLNEKNINHEFSETSDRLTISIGAVIVDVDNQYNIENAMKYADEMLYQAKKCGRNQVMIKAD